VYCGNAAKTLGFALMLMLNVFRDNCDRVTSITSFQWVWLATQ